MTGPPITQAMIMAAGYGKRMRPLTDNCPKPLLSVAGEPMIRRSVNQLQRAGVTDIVINVHYLGDQIIESLSNIDTVRLVFIKEDTLLETGGGLKNARHHFNEKPFFVVNGDSYLIQKSVNSTFNTLQTAWIPELMDMLLLLQPLDKMLLTHGVGDYNVRDNGHIQRSHDQNGTHMFTGIRIISPAVLDNTPDGAFSFLACMDRSEAQGRLFGLTHEGEWHHISTPQNIESVNKHLNFYPKSRAVP